MLPIKQKENAKVKKHLRLLLTEEESQEKLAFYQKKNQKARARLLEALKEAPILDYELVTKKLNVTLPVIRALEEQGVLKIESEQVYRNPVKQAKKSHQDHLYGRTAACDPGVPARLSVWNKENLSASRSDRKWKDRSLYGDDPHGC